MPKSMHEAVEIHLKTIDHLKELKQINKKKEFFGGRWAQGLFQGVQMERNGPTWGSMERKGYQKGAKSDENGAKRLCKNQK